MTSKAALGIVMANVVLLIPPGLLQRVINGSPDIVMDLLVPCNFVGSEPVEELGLFAEHEAVKVHPSTVNAVEGTMQVLLVVLSALDQCDIRQDGKSLCTIRLCVASEDPSFVPATIRKCCITYVRSRP